MSRRNLEAQVKQGKALDMRLRGMRMGKIAEELGYADQSGAQRAIEVACARTCPPEVADQVRRLELSRLDDILTVAYDKAMAGSLAAIDRVLAIMDRRARYLGLDAPIRIQQMVITDQDIIEAMERKRQEIMTIEASASVVDKQPVVDIDVVDNDEL